MTLQFEDTLERIKRSTGARTQVELANILGIRQSSISDAKRRNSVPADWYLKLYRSHGLNPDWLSDGIEPMYLKPGMAEAMPQIGIAEPSATYGQSLSRSRVVSVSSMAGAESQEGTWHPDHVRQLAIPEAYYRATLLVVQMDGTSMEPLIKPKAFVGLDTDQKRILSGEVYGILAPHEGLILRRVFYDAESDRIILRTENSSHPEQSFPAEVKNDRLMGRVVWVLQEV